MSFVAVRQSGHFSFSGKYSKYISCASTFFTSFSGVVVIAIGCASVTVLFELTVMLVVGLISNLTFLSQKSHLHAGTGMHVSRDAFQNELTTSVISAPMQMTPNVGEP